MWAPRIEDRLYINKETGRINNEYSNQLNGILDWKQKELAKLPSGTSYLLTSTIEEMVVKKILQISNERDEKLKMLANTSPIDYSMNQMLKELEEEIIKKQKA